VKEELENIELEHDEPSVPTQPLAGAGLAPVGGRPAVGMADQRGGAGGPAPQVGIIAVGAGKAPPFKTGHQIARVAGEKDKIPVGAEACIRGSNVVHGAGAEVGGSDVGGIESMADQGSHSRGLIQEEDV